MLNFSRTHFSLAYNFAASMFEGNGGARQISLANLETELYILGVKYRTPHGKNDRNRNVHSFYSFHRYVCN